jgi:hypothetical protein
VTDDHVHGPDGHVLPTDPVAADVSETETAAEAAVRIARIEAERDIKLAQIQAREVPRDLEAELAAALAELDALKAATEPAVAAPEATADPAPVVVVADAPGPSADVTELPEREMETPRREKRSDPWFGGRA